MAPIKQLEKAKDAAYKRPEEYPFERFDKLMTWAMARVQQTGKAGAK